MPTTSTIRKELKVFSFKRVSRTPDAQSWLVSECLILCSPLYPVYVFVPYSKKLTAPTIPCDCVRLLRYQPSGIFLKDILLQIKKYSYREIDTATVGIIFCFTTFLFKVGASPFHMWLCDVYEGSLTSVTLFFAAVPKLVLFYLLIKLSLTVLPAFDNFWKTFFLASGLLSIAVGSMGALIQKKVKRLLAFSAISHTGFVLLALCSGSYLSIKATVFYLVFYAIMTFATFSIVLISINQTNFLKYLISWSYLSKRNFCLAITFTLVFFSLAGIPPLTGFYSKLLVFLALLNEQKIITMTVMALLSCLGCFYYIRIIKILFFCSNTGGVWVYSSNRILEFTLATSSLIITFFLVRPDSVLQNSLLLSLSFI